MAHQQSSRLLEIGGHRIWSPWTPMDITISGSTLAPCCHPNTAPCHCIPLDLGYHPARPFHCHPNVPAHCCTPLAPLLPSQASTLLPAPRSPLPLKHNPSCSCCWLCRSGLRPRLSLTLTSKLFLKSSSDEDSWSTQRQLAWHQQNPDQIKWLGISTPLMKHRPEQAVMGCRLSAPTPDDLFQYLTILTVRNFSLIYSWLQFQPCHRPQLFSLPLTSSAEIISP